MSSSISDRICVYKDGHRRYISPSLLDQYLNDGYSKTYQAKEVHVIDELSQKISREELFNFYEIENHTKEETANFFNLSFGKLNSLLKFYNIKKSKHNRGFNSKMGKLNKYGDENYNNRDKAKETCLVKYNVTSPLQMERVREKAISHETRLKAQQTYKDKTGKKVWNEGETGLQTWIEGQAERRSNTLKEHNSFNTSKPEEELYKELCEKYGEVKRQYNEDPRYPWHCDFYIPSEDLFIELNKFPTHYVEPFDETNPEHIKLLEHCKNEPNNWIEEQMVNIWAGTDVIKYNKAKQENLNYEVIY